MKQIINLITAIAIVILIIPNANAQKDKTKKTVDKISVQVDGLGCPFCAYGLEKKMKELKGVKKFEIQMESGLTSFTFPSDKMLTLEQVKAQVEKAGYTPMDLEIVRADGTNEKLEFEEQVVDYKANKKIEFAVNGNCNMCEGRIERAALSLYGVSSAAWSKKKKRIKVEYLDSEISEKDIHFAINKAGYDTEKAIADNEAYDKLPGCCQYDRMDVKVQFVPTLEPGENTDQTDSKKEETEKQDAPE